MEFIKANFEIVDQEPGLEGMYKAAELPGRVCYGSQDKICPGSAEKFVKNLMKSNHGAPLEHGTVYLKVPEDVSLKYQDNKYSVVKIHSTDTTRDIIICTQEYRTTVYEYYVTTNLRVLFENGWMDDLQYWCEPTEWHERRVMVHFLIDRFTGEEYLRHRVASFNRESTRYCNYSKEKFGAGSIKFILPPWVEDATPMSDEQYRHVASLLAERNKFWYKVKKFFRFILNEEPISAEVMFKYALKSSEIAYNKLIADGWQPQQARTVLPCAINSPLYMTCTMTDWLHFFRLRALGTTGAPHPQAKELAYPLMVEFKNRGWIDFNEEEKKVWSLV